MGPAGGQTPVCGPHFLLFCRFPLGEGDLIGEALWRQVLQQTSFFGAGFFYKNLAEGGNGTAPLAAGPCSTPASNRWDALLVAEKRGC